MSRYRAFTKQERLDAYEDWRNNYLTVERFAEHYELSEADALELIASGRALWDERALAMQLADGKKELGA